MSTESTPLPANPSLAQLQKRAKERVRELRAAGKPNATLADAQFAIAHEHGFETWAKLKHHIQALRPEGIELYERLANNLAKAYSSGDETAVRAINAHYGTAFPTDFHNPVKAQQCLPAWYSSETREPALAVADARQMVAHAYGFEDWAKFAGSLTQHNADPGRAPAFVATHPRFYTIDWEDDRLSARGPQTRRDWEEIFATIEENGISKVRAGGITDDSIKGLARLQCVTHLDVSGSKGLTDDGAQNLAQMAQLIELEIGGRHTMLTDRAFAPLRHFPLLQSLKACWTRGFDDTAAAHLARCEQLVTVSALGSAAGDSLIRALVGKTELRFLETGSGVTDAGLSSLRGIPVFGRWLGGEVRAGLMGAREVPNQLTIDGPFTDQGLASLAGLDGVAALSFFWHSKAFTAAGLEPLRRMGHLEFLGIWGDQCSDEAMHQISAIPRLRQLQAQGAVAGDVGWRALARSQTLEYIWGRECPNFRSPGFLAIAEMSRLRGMGIGCAQVDDEVLALLPRFRQLRDLVSIGVSDAGFRHVGRCENLESLYCMYCRDTGDAATEHLAGLQKLRTYYAGMTQITDRSLEILGRMDCLEKLEFWQCMGITDAGMAQLARLPHLRHMEVHNCPSVSQKIRQLFREPTRVLYTG